MMALRLRGSSWWSGAAASTVGSGLAFSACSLGDTKVGGGDGLADIMGQKFSIDVNSGGTES